jgi:histone deacetylase HOS3
MALRERKAAKVIESIEEDEEVLAKNRRKTIGVPTITTEKVSLVSHSPGLDTWLTAFQQAVARGIPAETNGKPAPRRQSRRLSGSSIVIPASPDVSSRRPASRDREGSQTAMSFRPESSMGARTQTGTPLAVKKSRPVNAVKKDVPKPRAGLKRTPLPSSAKASPAPSSRASGNGDDTADELEKITSGMRKIKINLITKSQKEAREREEAEKKLGTPKEETPPTIHEDSVFAIPALPARSSSLDQNDEDISPTGTAPPRTPLGFSTPTQELVMSPDRGRVPLPSSSPALHTPTTELAPASPDMFVPYQPEGPEPVAIAQQEPLKWLAPNTNTPSPMKRTELPVFTATSAIPFGPPSSRKQQSLKALSGQGGDATVKMETKPDKSVWDVPPTPQK